MGEQTSTIDENNKSNTLFKEGNRPLRVDAVVISTQHAPEVEMEALRKDILEHVSRPVVPAELLDEQTKYYVCL